MIQCQCKAHDRKGFTGPCGCHKQNLSYTAFCNCNGGQDFLNPFTANREFVQSAAGETETDEIDKNLPDDSDDGL